MRALRRRASQHAVPASALYWMLVCEHFASSYALDCKPNVCPPGVPCRLHPCAASGSHRLGHSAASGNPAAGPVGVSLPRMSYEAARRFKDPLLAPYGKSDRLPWQRAGWQPASACCCGLLSSALVPTLQGALRGHPSSNRLFTVPWPSRTAQHASLPPFTQACNRSSGHLGCTPPALLGLPSSHPASEPCLTLCRPPHSFPTTMQPQCRQTRMLRGSWRLRSPG